MVIVYPLKGYPCMMWALGILFRVDTKKFKLYKI